MIYPQAGYRRDLDPRPGSLRALGILETIWGFLARGLKIGSLALLLILILMWRIRVSLLLIVGGFSWFLWQWGKASNPGSSSPWLWRKVPIRCSKCAGFFHRQFAEVPGRKHKILFYVCPRCKRYLHAPHFRV